MQPVTCAQCRAQVEVRKSSWDQTSIQWHDDAMSACLERRAALPGQGPKDATFVGCSALRDAIREAAVRGDLGVQSDEPLPVNTEAPEVYQ